MIYSSINLVLGLWFPSESCLRFLDRKKHYEDVSHEIRVLFSVIGIDQQLVVPLRVIIIWAGCAKTILITKNRKFSY